MTKLVTLVNHIEQLLDVASFKDYCPNGLQVEGRPEVAVLVSGVTASRGLIEAAIERGADAILVHHGYFWRGEDPCITGIKRARLERILTHGISLLAYHLPLDAHPELGNNVQLARALDIEVDGPIGTRAGDSLIFQGQLPAPMTAAELSQHVAGRLGREVLHIPGGPAQIRSIGWCTGAAQGFIDQAAAQGLDAYLSGEISEQTTHTAREAEIHYFAAGHHATERYGVRALGEYLAQQFGIKHGFVDIDNPA